MKARSEGKEGGREGGSDALKEMEERREFY